ncbi:MAG: BrnA antitoxin family protein [Novosphingobium sp.]|uniref:BrnA antitoxin family protein n=1 Tax=Novosphingobium sp. TaxID=1874826 RepID=UPI0032BD69A3
MTEKEKAIALLAKDPDEIKPELDDDWFAEADAYVGTKLVRRGRPRAANPKKPVSLRLDADVLDWFKRKGEGWQTKINDELRRAAGL